MVEVLRVLLYIAFTLSSLLLILVILFQEGKGGGLAAAFGGAGGDTFGVGSGGINRFTSILAAVFIGTAVILASLPSRSTSETIGQEEPVQPVHQGGGPSSDSPSDQPAGGGGGGESGN